jgi:hypothetical protein
LGASHYWYGCQSLADGWVEERVKPVDFAAGQHFGERQDEISLDEVERIMI